MNLNLEFNYGKATSAMDIYSENDMNRLRQWTQSQEKSKIIPNNMTDKQILLFYNACYGDVEKTKVCIEKYYTCRKNAPEIFDNRVFNLDDLKQAAETIEAFILPGKSCEGYEIIFHRLHDTDPSKFNDNSVFKLLLMTVDLLLSTQGPHSGFIFIFDMQGVKLKHLTKMSLSSLRKLIQYVQEAVPIRMKAIHVLNADAVLDKLMIFVKPFIHNFHIIKFHNKTSSQADLHEIIPKSSLPSEFGGTLPDTQTLHKECLEQLRRLEPYFKAEEEQRKALRDKK